MPSKPAILAITGPEFTPDEAALFAAERPFGFIVFARNILNPAQLQALVSRFRELVNDPQAPVLIDQEGGRVARLREPHWETFPAPRAIGELYERDAERGVAAARLLGRLLGQQAARVGFNVVCAPVVDLAVAGADPIMGDRCFSTEPAAVATLARAECEGLLAAGVLPVLKHIPGHGRATADSHLTLPVVSEPREMLTKTDFAPFHSLAAMPLAMTAHIRYPALDAECCATLSPRVIQEIVRGEIGFDGLLMSDDLSMQALTLPKPEAARQALAAGCDVVLECKGVHADNVAVLAGLSPLSAAATRRWQRALAMLSSHLDVTAERAELLRLLA